MDNRIKVWAYWHSDDRPAIINECIASWRRHLDSEKFKIIVLSENNLHQYLPAGWLEQIPDFQSLHIANQADFIRLSLLKFHGGVWLDASIYLLQDFSFIESFDRFYAPRFPILDHSNVQVFFLVAPKNDVMINKWLDLYIDILKSKQRIKHRWYHLSMYSGLGILVVMDKKFRTYFQVYEAYSLLYTSDKTFRQNTPKFDKYGLKASFRLENFTKILNALSLLLLSRFIIIITNSTNAKDPLKLRQRVHNMMTKKQKPSISLKRDGKIVFYKLNAADRKQLTPHFRFEQDPGLSNNAGQ